LLKIDTWTEEDGVLYKLSDVNNVEACSYFMPDSSAHAYYKQVKKDPDPNDVYGEQDELWDDENFLPPNGTSRRVLPTHEELATNENNAIFS